MSNDPYQVAITAIAAADLERLPKKIAKACIEFLFGALADDPYQFGTPLRAELEGLHCARRGDYRIIYAINDSGRRLEIVHIDRRSAVYQ